MNSRREIAMVIDQKQLEQAARTYGTPLYVYSRDYLQVRAGSLLDICRKHAINARYAVKANPHPEIIKLFDQAGLAFDASSEFEAQRLLENGVEAGKISLSSQQVPADLANILQSGVNFVATSLHQLELAAAAGWHGGIGIRINPGIGAGHNNRTKTGGLASSFGIWHDYVQQILEWEKSSACRINKIHVHIGSGGDPSVWQQAVGRCLELAGRFPNVDILDMGGGFKVSRMPNEPEADMGGILETFAQAAKSFQSQTGRPIRLEIEPGAWLTANSGVLLAKVIDIVDTGPEGYKFIKLDTGMNDFLRPAMYGAQHPIEILNQAETFQEYAVVGHNCETGDILTPAPGNPEAVAVRKLRQAAIGDLAAIGGAGAYAASMRAIGYNDFPPAKEIFIS